MRAKDATMKEESWDETTLPALISPARRRVRHSELGGRAPEPSRSIIEEVGKQSSLARKTLNAVGRKLHSHLGTDQQEVQEPDEVLRCG